MRARGTWEMVAIQLASAVRVMAPDLADRIATQMENPLEGIPYTPEMRMEMATVAKLLRFKPDQAGPQEVQHD